MAAKKKTPGLSPALLAARKQTAQASASGGSPTAQPAGGTPKPAAPAKAVAKPAATPAPAKKPAPAKAPAPKPAPTPRAPRPAAAPAPTVKVTNTVNAGPKKAKRKPRAARTATPAPAPAAAAATPAPAPAPAAATTAPAGGSTAQQLTRLQKVALWMSARTPKGLPLGTTVRYGIGLVAVVLLFVFAHNLGKDERESKAQGKNTGTESANKNDQVLPSHTTPTRTATSTIAEDKKDDAPKGAVAPSSTSTPVGVPAHGTPAVNFQDNHGPVNINVNGCCQGPSVTGSPTTTTTKVWPEGFAPDGEEYLLDPNCSPKPGEVRVMEIPKTVPTGNGWKYITPDGKWKATFDSIDIMQRRNLECAVDVSTGTEPQWVKLTQGETRRVRAFWIRVINTDEAIPLVFSLKAPKQ